MMMLDNQDAMTGKPDNTKINKCTLKFIMPKEKEVELIREDGSKEILKLVK